FGFLAAEIGHFFGQATVLMLLLEHRAIDGIPGARDRRVAGTYRGGAFFLLAFLFPLLFLVAITVLFTGLATIAGAVARLITRLAIGIGFTCAGFGLTSGGARFNALALGLLGCLAGVGLLGAV